MPSLKLNTVGKKGKKTGSLKDVSMEAIERVGRDPDIDHSKSHLNIIRGYQSTEGLMAYSDKHIQEMNIIRKSQGKKAIRKDAVRMCATIIKPPAAEMRDISYEDQIRFFDTAVDTFGEIVGTDNIKTVAIHFDEKGPHAHILWEPMTSDGELCAKKVHDRTFFHNVNECIPKALRKAGFDVEDCNMYEMAEEEYAEERKKNAGRTSSEYKRDAEKKKHELDILIQEKEQEYADKTGRVLTFDEVTAITEKKVPLRKDIVLVNKEELKDLRTTAMHVEESDAERERAIEKMNQALADKANAENDAAIAIVVADEKMEKAETMVAEYEDKKSELEKEKQEFQEHMQQEKEKFDQDCAEKEAATQKRADQIIDGAVRKADVIITGAEEKVKQIEREAEDKKESLTSDIQTLQYKKFRLSMEVGPLSRQAENAHEIIDDAKAKADGIRAAAYQDGYDAGKKEGKKDYLQLIETAKDKVSEAEDEKESILTVARSDADRIRRSAEMDARIMLDDAKRKADEELAPKKFWDELMSIEGEGDFKKYRKESWFWLEVEKACKEALPAREKLKELEAIVSFIPKFIMDRAREIYKKLRRAWRPGDDYVSTQEPKHIYRTR